MYFSGSTAVHCGPVLCSVDTENGWPCASCGRDRVRGVCQFVLICATTLPAHAGQIDCSATGLVKSGTAVPAGGVWYRV